MLTRAALALLLLLPAAAAQDLDTAVSAVVRISGTRGETPVRGTGFVVGLDPGKATIVTAAHVIEGVQHLEVTFAVDRTESYSVGAVLGMDAGLAIFQVRGALPAGVNTLSFEVESRPRPGEALILLGFPQMELAPRTTQRVLSGRRGTLLLVDQEIGEGFSGGPVLQGGKVVGVVTDMDAQTTYAVNAVVAREAVVGLGFDLCVTGNERTENGIVFVRVCRGAFTMGSAENELFAFAEEKPAHKVTLSDFWIGKTEITNEQYRRFRSNHQGEAGLPVTNVSWIDAKAACEHFGGHLPTEAQWEYAARAGSQTIWPSGDNTHTLGEYAWYEENSSGTPHPAGTKKPNAWGLHDMHGNVYEWVADWYSPSYTSAAQTDPTGPAEGTERVLRGGTFDQSFLFMRPAFRLMSKPESRSKLTGFRCVLVSHSRP